MTFKAGYANPCDEQLNACICQVPGCKRMARFARTLRKRDRTSEPGVWYTRTFSGARHPISRADHELICGVHLKDWKYGPLSPEDRE